MTPERIAGIRKSFTCADVDALCDFIEEARQEALDLNAANVKFGVDLIRATHRAEKAEAALKVLSEYYCSCPVRCFICKVLA